MRDNQEFKPEPTTEGQVPGSDKEPALYDRFAEKSREIFERGENRGREAWEKAMELARRQLSVAGDFSAEQGEAFKRYLRRDLDQTLREMRHLGSEAKVLLHPARLGAGALSSMARLTQALGSAFHALSAKAEEALFYEAGEITMAGTLTCTNCGHKIQLTHSSIVPTCPECQGTRFRKGY